MKDRAGWLLIGAGVGSLATWAYVVYLEWKEIHDA